MPLNVSLGRGLVEFGDVAVDECEVSPLSLGKMWLWLEGWFCCSREFGSTLCRIDQGTLGILLKSSKNLGGTVAGCSFNQGISDPAPEHEAVSLRFRATVAPSRTASVNPAPICSLLL